MIRYTFKSNARECSNLFSGMFRDRARQFSTRLNWNVEVDEDGLEHDQYDDLDPLYITVENANGDHLASMRLLPTIGRTMINEHFVLALGNQVLQDQNVWECTRLCISDSAEPKTALKVFAAAAKVMNELNINRFVATFDQIMLRRYRLSGLRPRIIGSMISNNMPIFIGEWHFDPEVCQKLMLRSQTSSIEIELALANLLPTTSPINLIAQSA